MKSALLALIAASAMSASAMASSINVTSETLPFSRWEDQMANIVYSGERAMDDYLGRTLECRLVRLELNVIRKHGLFKKGLYNVALSAECNKTFKDFQMEIIPGYSGGEPFGYNLSFIQNGRKVEKKIQLESSDD